MCVCLGCFGSVWVLLLEDELRVVRSGLEAAGG